MANTPSLKGLAQSAAGLPSKEQLLLSSQNTDKVPAQIQGAQGLPPQPAALTHGEFVMSIPAIIGMGNGNYDHGLAMLTHIHNQLQAHGEKLMGTTQGGASIPGLPQQ